MIVLKEEPASSGHPKEVRNGSGFADSEAATLAALFYTQLQFPL